MKTAGASATTHLNLSYSLEYLIVATLPARCFLLSTFSEVPLNQRLFLTKIIQYTGDSIASEIYKLYLYYPL